MPRRESPIAARKGIFSKTGGDESEVEELPTVPRKKRTYYIPDDVVLMLNEVQMSEYRKTGEKPELSDLVAEAIQKLAAERLDAQAS